MSSGGLSIKFFHGSDWQLGMTRTEPGSGIPTAAERKSLT